MKRILYVSQLCEADDPRKALAPSEAVTIPPMLAALGATATVVDATLGLPPDPADYDGVIVGGSFGSANHTESWRLALRGWLQALGDRPVFGICGGHQLYAHARGAVVEACPAPQMGVYPLTLEGVPGYTGLVVQLHGERVAAPPDGAEVWATDDAGIQALRYGPNRWTFQFHPEMDPDVVRVAGAINGLGEAAWVELDRATRGGRALLAAWLARV